MTLFRVFRGTRDGGGLHDYQVAATEGMVVLDAVHAIQAEQAPDLAVRWNCKAGKCGSCSAEINGKPRLLCMTRMSDYPADETITVTQGASAATVHALASFLTLCRSWAALDVDGLLGGIGFDDEAPKVVGGLPRNEHEQYRAVVAGSARGIQHIFLGA